MSEIFYWFFPDVIIVLTAITVLIFIQIKSKYEIAPKSKNDINEDPKYRAVYSELNHVLIISYVQSVLETCK